MRDKTSESNSFGICCAANTRVPGGPDRLLGFTLRRSEMKLFNIRELMCRVSGSNCRFCNSRQVVRDCASAADLYHEHKSHRECVSLNAVMCQPRAYEGLRIQMPL